MDLIKKAKQGLVGLILGATTLLPMGCETMGIEDVGGIALKYAAEGETDPDKARAMNFLGDVGVIAGQRQHDLNVAERGRSQVNVNVNPPQDRTTITYHDTPAIMLGPTDERQQRMYQQSDPWKDFPRFFTYTRFVDINRNNIIDPPELFGVNKSEYSLQEEIYNAFHTKDYSGNLKFCLFTEDGKLLAETNITALQNQLEGRYTSPNGERSSPPDYMDILRDSGVGRYRFTVTLYNGYTYANDIKIVP